MSKANSLAVQVRPKGRLAVVPINPDVAAVNGLVDQLYAICIESSNTFRLIESGNRRACRVKLQKLISAMHKATANAQIIDHELGRGDAGHAVLALKAPRRSRSNPPALPPPP